VPLKYFLVSRKLDTFCYLTAQTAPCYMQSFKTQYRRVTGGQTDRRTELPQLVQRLQCEYRGAL